jgi:hypothetical protein
MILARSERMYEKYAWIIFFAIGVLSAFFSVSLLSGVGDFGKEAAVVGLGFAIFTMAIAATSYRKGEKWAWYAFLYLPLQFLSFVFIDVNDTRKVSFVLVPAIFLILSLAGLFLPYRKFFPKRQTA